MSDPAEFEPTNKLLRECKAFSERMVACNREGHQLTKIGNRYECKGCGRIYTNPNALQKHRITEDKSDEPRE